MMNKFKNHLFIKIVSIIVIFTFLTLDLAWACPPPEPSHNLTLAAQCAFQQTVLDEFEQSIVYRASVLNSILHIAKYLLEDFTKGNKSKRLASMESVVGSELAAPDVRIKDVINLSNVRFHPKKKEVVVIPCETAQGKTLLVQIALFKNLSAEELSGFKRVLSDKYAFTVHPKGYKEEPKAPKKPKEVTISEKPIAEVEIGVEVTELTEAGESRVWEILRVGVKAITMLMMLIMMISIKNALGYDGKPKMIPDIEIYSRSPIVFWIGIWVLAMLVFLQIWHMISPDPYEKAMQANRRPGESKKALTLVSLLRTQRILTIIFLFDWLVILHSIIRLCPSDGRYVYPSGALPALLLMAVALSLFLYTLIIPVMYHSLRSYYKEHPDHKNYPGTNGIPTFGQLLRIEIARYDGYRHPALGKEGSAAGWAMDYGIFASHIFGILGMTVAPLKWICTNPEQGSQARVNAYNDIMSGNPKKALAVMTMPWTYFGTNELAFHCLINEEDTDKLLEILKFARPSKLYEFDLRPYLDDYDYEHVGNLRDWTELPELLASTIEKLGKLKEPRAIKPLMELRDKIDTEIPGIIEAINTTLQKISRLSKRIRKWEAKNIASLNKNKVLAEQLSDIIDLALDQIEDVSSLNRFEIQTRVLNWLNEYTYENGWRIEAKEIQRATVEDYAKAIEMLTDFVRINGLNITFCNIATECIEIEYSPERFRNSIDLNKMKKMIKEKLAEKHESGTDDEERILHTISPKTRGGSSAPETIKVPEEEEEEDLETASLVKLIKSTINNTRTKLTEAGNTVITFLARQDELPEEADLLLVLPSDDPDVPKEAAKLYDKVKFKKVLFLEENQKELFKEKRRQLLNAGEEQTPDKVPKDVFLSPETHAQHLEENLKHAATYLEEMKEKGKITELKSVVIMQSPLYSCQTKAAVAKNFRTSKTSAPEKCYVYAPYVPEIDRDKTTAEVVKGLEQVLTAAGSLKQCAENKTIDEVQVPEEVDEALTEIKKNLNDLEAGSIIASIIILARRAKRQNQDLIIGVETDWIPGYDEQSKFQYMATNPLINEFKSIADKLKEKGLDNVKMIFKDKNTSLDNWADALENELTKRKDFSNLIVMGGKTAIQYFDSVKLSGIGTDKRPFLASIDATYLDAFYEAHGEDMKKQLNIKIAQMFSLTLDLAVGKSVLPEFPGIKIVYIGDQRKVIFIPSAGEINFEKLSDDNNLKKIALKSV